MAKKVKAARHLDVEGETWKDETGLLKEDGPRPAFVWLMDYLGR